MGLLACREGHPAWLAALGEGFGPFGRIRVTAIALDHLPSTLEGFVKPDIKALPDGLLCARHGGGRVLRDLPSELFRPRTQSFGSDHLRDQADRLGLASVH